MQEQQRYEPNNPFPDEMEELPLKPPPQQSPPPLYESGLQAQPARVSQKQKTEVSSNGTRFRNIFYLTLTGILAIVLIFAATIVALSILPVSVAITVVAFAGSVVAVVGTFIGSQTGYLIGSSGKEHAERRTDDLQNALISTIKKFSSGSKE